MQKLFYSKILAIVFPILFVANAQGFTKDDIIKVDGNLGPQLKPRAPEKKLVTPVKRQAVDGKLSGKAAFSRDTIDWSKEIVYFLLVDRFNDGDPSNNAVGSKYSHKVFDGNLKNKQALKTYQGGDIKGVIEKLDYLADLGITALWISPLFENANKDYFGWWPYHGYHPSDLYGVEDHFGDMELVKKLVAECHKRNIKVLLDMTFNHVGPEHPFVVDKYLWKGQKFSKWFHPHSETDGSTSIQNWEDQNELETYEVMGLPDFNQDNPYVYDYLLDVSKYWVRETGADGFRLDAVKHVNKDFWKKINKDMKEFAGDDFLMLGEVFSGDPKYLAGYQDLGFDTLFDIPLYYTLRQVFAQGGSIDILSNRLIKDFSVYKDDFLPSLLIDNHDLQRFAHLTPDRAEERIKLGLTFIHTVNGIPVIYYGTEVALEGGPDKDPETGEGTDYLNRRMMPWDRVEKDLKNPKGITSHIRSLTKARKANPSLIQGQFIELYKDPSTYIYGKVAKTDISIVGLNTSSDKRKVDVPLRYDLVKKGEFKSLLSSNTSKVSKGKIVMELEPFASEILNIENDSNKVLPKGYEVAVKKSDYISSDFVMVDFKFDPKTTRPKSVFISGDFNGWKAEETPMELNQQTKSWEIKLPLKPGRYLYKFVINGKEWIPDPKAKEFEPDPFGGKNSIVNVVKM